MHTRQYNECVEFQLFLDLAHLSKNSTQKFVKNSSKKDHGSGSKTGSPSTQQHLVFGGHAPPIRKNLSKSVIYVLSKLAGRKRTEEKRLFVSSAEVNSTDSE